MDIIWGTDIGGELEREHVPAMEENEEGVRKLLIELLTGEWNTFGADGDYITVKSTE